MNNNFSLSRLGLLLRKHLSENMRTYLISCLVLAAIIAVALITMSLIGGNTVGIDEQAALYFVSLIVGGFVFAANTFKNYHSPRSGISALMLPASTMEKYGVHWLVTFFAFASCHLLLFHGAQYIVFQSTYYVFEIENSYFNVFNNSPDVPVIWFCMIFLLVHSVALLGSATLKKNAVIVSALILIGVTVLYIFINFQVTSLIFRSGTPLPIGPVSTFVDNQWVRISFPHEEIIGITSIIALALLIWTTAFFKLKEKEI